MLLAMLGCKPVSDKKPHIDPIIAIDESGKKYRFVSPEMVNSNGVVISELWERIQPPDTNNWYTPSLSSKLDTNKPKSFNALMR